MIIASLGMRPENMNGLAAHVQPGIHDSFLSKAVELRADSKERLKLALDGPLADDHHPAFLTDLLNPVLFAEEACVVGVLRGKPIQDLFPLAIAKRLLKDNHVV